jgi:Family of unknown function (DUF5906)
MTQPRPSQPETDGPPPGICRQCRRTPPDGNERCRELSDGESLWLHPGCEDAYARQRSHEEDIDDGPAATNGATPHQAAAIGPGGAALEPNLADINAHLYAIFAPEFVKEHPDAWIEIANADPKAPDTVTKKGVRKKNTGPKSSRHFSVFDLAKAAAYAVRINKQGRNIYVGMALRQGETGKFSNGRATKDNVVTASRGWGDFDGAGDDVRVHAALKQKGLEVTEMVLTGTIPHHRFQIFFNLAGPVTPEQLEAVNEAIRDGLGGNGDGVQNCDRIMRLAGTVSYPPPDKVARGYVPELTKLHTMNARAYPVDELLRRLKDVPASAAKPNYFRPTAAPAATPGNNTADLGEQTFWRKVNEMALANLGAWVPEIFGDDAVFQKGTGAYRISSESLGRDLEEDLSISPKGITDWGLDDQGEKKTDKIGRRTAIDIVIEHGGAANAKAAALWLCEKMAVDPASLGWKRGAIGGASDNPVTREIERLAALSRVDYETERTKAAKALGFRKKVLDDLVAQMRGPEPESEEVASEVAQLNKDYALVLAGNKAAVMKFDAPTKFRLLQTSAFTTWFGNQHIMAAGTMVPLGEYWLRHAERRQYSGIEFAPPGTPIPATHYNLWQGFAVVPRRGNCWRFLKHIWDNVAKGDKATFRWIVGWWAQILQQPSVKMETALALRGGYGAGKTKIGQIFGSLIPSHYRLVANPRYVTGQFNSHMASLLVLHADEAFWAGDKKGEGTLKDLVSGKTHMLEYKGVDPIEILNFIRLFVTGNLDWMVPAGFRDRRWAIFDIGEDQMQNHAYFAAIDEQMDNGGREALLHYLLNFDLKTVNLRVVPKTAALFDQQVESMNAEEAWWFEVLMRGALPSRPQGVKEANVCSRDDLFETYILHARLQGISRRTIETKLGMFLNKQLGDALTSYQPVVGNSASRSTKARPAQRRCYRLPSLRECRDMFASKLGQPIVWGSSEQWETEVWQQSDDWRDIMTKAVRHQTGSFFS